MAVQQGVTGSAACTAGVREQDGAIVVELSGELDLSTAPELRETLACPAVLSASTVRVDLTQATFIDSCTIGMLVSACKRVRASGNEFTLHCPEGSMMRHTLELAGLVEYLNVDGA
jgi:anti-sigma B factor antagonist